MSAIREPLAYGPKPPNRMLEWSSKQLSRLLVPGAESHEEWQGLSRSVLDSWIMNAAAAFDDQDVIDQQDQLIDRFAETLDGLDVDAPDQLMKFRRSREARDYALKTNPQILAVVKSRGHISVVELGESFKRAKALVGWLEKAGKLHLDGDEVVWGRKPRIKKPKPTLGAVPPFKSHSATRGSLRTAARKEFYARFRAAALDGEMLELEGQLSYAFVLISEEIPELAPLSPQQEQLLRLFLRHHADDPLGQYSRDEILTRHVLAEDFSAIHDEFADMPMPLAYHINFLTTPLGVVALEVMDADSILKISNQLTGFSETHKDRIELEIQNILDTRHKELEMSVLHDLWVRIVTPEATPRRPVTVADFGHVLTERKLNVILDRIREQYAWADPEGRGQWHDGKLVLGSSVAGQQGLEWPGLWRETHAFTELAKLLLQGLYREAENTTRVEAGLPAVGEGWVSEMMLLNLIREAFPEHQVIHQGRPQWLVPQSFDIYFPNERIGIEYQGAQHSRPVELFGGQEAFENQQRRDERKRQLSRENHCALIEVFPGYDAEAVLSQVRETLRTQAE